MATRIQLRRDTGANWILNDPILAAGEVAISTDLEKIKIGDGTSSWLELSYINLTPTEIQSEINSAVSALVDNSPELLDTLNELAAAINDDPDFFNTIATNLSNHESDTTNIHGITDTSDLVYTDDPRLIDERPPGLHASTHEFGGTDEIEIAPSQVTGTAVITTDSRLSDQRVPSDDSVTSAKIVNGSIIDADINASAAIAPSKISGTAVITTDSRLSDSRTPTSHAASHASGQSDALTLSQSQITGLETSLLSKAPIASPTFTGTVTLASDPTSALHAATKQYVDNIASGIVAKPSVLGATTENLNATYSNGTLGVNATLTSNSNGVFPSNTGGATGWELGSGILVKDQTNKAQNGRYYISNMGTVSTPYVLTRCGYCDEADEIPGAYIFVQSGTNEGTGWIQIVDNPSTFVVGTNDINVYQFTGEGTYTAGTGISINANVISLASHSHAISDVTGLQTALDGKAATNQTMYIGTTSLAINRSSATQSLTGITSIDGSASSLTTARTLTIGSTGKTFNGTANVAWSIAEIGAAPLASPTFTGTVTTPTLLLTTADTTTPATHYFVETGTDGIVRPKTLANTRTEIVTTAAVNTAAATTVGAVTSGTWGATDIGLAHGGTNASLTAANGGVVYSTSTAMAITSAGTSGQVLTSNGASAPTWQDAAGGLESASVTVTANDTATTLTTFSTATYSSAEMFIQQKQGTKMTTSKILVMWDGTDVSITEFAVMDASAGAANSTITATHSGGTVSVTASSSDAAATNVIIKATVNYIAA